MANAGDEFELGEILLILGALGVGLYLLYKLAGSVSSYFKNSLCLSKVGTVPGVTGATEAQSKAPQIAAENLKPGGSVIWTCSNDSTQYDYAEPCGDVVQVRHSFLGQLFGTPATYTTIPRDQYVRPSGGTVNPAFACCYGCTPATAAGGCPSNGGLGGAPGPFAGDF